MEIISGILVIDCSKDPWELTKEELAYIPKPLLLQHWGDCIPFLWTKLPEHIKRDPEVASYQLCRKHWGMTNLQARLEGYPPTRRDCMECQQAAYEAETGTTPSPTDVSSAETSPATQETNMTSSTAEPDTPRPDTPYTALESSVTAETNSVDV